jgi:hypothetical protein
VYHPTRGWALQSGLRDLRVFGGKTLSSNSQGLRGRAEHAYPKPEGRQRIAIFGDSFTFGEGVSDGETYSTWLERLLQEAEVLNFGVHGYGHDQMLLYLQEQGVRYHADVVMLGFVYDDMERDLLEFRDYAKPRFRLEGGRLRLEGCPVPTPNEVLRTEARRSRFLELSEVVLDALFWRAGKGGRGENPAVPLLSEFCRIAREGGSRVVFAYLPTHDELAGPLARLRDRSAFFEEFCGSHALSCVSLIPAFQQAATKGASFNPLRHWEPWEHRLAAEGIASLLQ